MQPRQRRHRVITVVLSLLFALTLLGLAYSASSTWGLILSVIAAVIPAIVFARVILSFDRYEPEPLRAVIMAFLWGGGGAVIFAIIAEVVFVSGLQTATSQDGATALGVVVGAPLIEETFKGIALLALLWFYRQEFDGVIDGLIYGAMIGLGFSVVENIGYFLSAYSEDGAGAVGELFIARVLVNGLGHAVYTGVTGAAVGYSRSQYSHGWKRVAVPFFGFLLAVFLHMAWNLGVGLIAYWLSDGASLLQVVLVGGLILVLPALLIFVTIARRAGRKEREVMLRQLAPEVAYGVLNSVEYQALTARVEWLDRFLPGRRGSQLQQRFAQVCGELAFRKEHLSRGDPPTAGELDRLNYYRAQIAYLRPVQSLPRVASEAA